MRLDWSTEGLVQVAISKRNLLALLHKVDVDWSACTITKLEIDPLCPGRYTELRLVVEPDEVHYSHESRVVPGLVGAMHPETEAYIRAEGKCGATDPEGQCSMPFGHAGACEMDWPMPKPPPYPADDEDQV